MKQLISVGVLVCIFISCSGNKTEDKRKNQEVPVSNLSGSELAKIHCGRCHAFVAPELLTKSNWKNDVLPAMGYRMGIYEGRHQPDSLFAQDSVIIRKANIYPEQPVLAKVDWNKLITYYLQNSPDTIPPPKRSNKIKMGLKHFNYKETNYSSRTPFTALVKILPENRGVVYSDLKPHRNTLSFLNSDLKKNFKIGLNATAIHYYEKSNAIYLTTIGNNIFPNDAADGMLQKIQKNNLGQMSNQQTVLLSDLQRPVFMAYGDLNNDKREDIVVCEFGNHTGQLAWYQNNGNDKYLKHTLRAKPGAITAIIKDMNQDGFNDIIALMAQGDEAVFYYQNNGDDSFTEKRLLSFSPLNGSQYIELADFNNDGLDDLLYVCGDNADKTPHLKNYHGIYIFINDGDLNFTQSYFYQMNGAYKAIPRDFDLDGDLDIAAISFFPDYLNYPEESFIYLENKGNLVFSDSSFPQSTNGRWIVMDAADMDADGDIDIALGSFVYFIAKGDTTNLAKKWFSNGPSIIVLENTIR